jgi:UDP-N-acetylmuramoyl-tripeptide--D-alanyl-D-alanine ligase
VNGVKFFLPVLGAHQALLAAGAAAVAAEFGLALQDVAEALEHFTPPPMRMALERAGDVLVLNDAHNANPESMAAALDLLALWPERRKVFFCGDMKELGRAAPAAHDALGRSVAAAGVGRLVCVGELAARVGRAAERAGLAADAISTLADAAEAAAEAAGIVRPGDLVLVKGSRVMGMERIATVLQAQGAASPGS